MSGDGYVYAGVTRWRGGTRSGVFRMTIGEDRWAQLNEGLPLDVHVQTVVVHPDNPETLLAGTNDGPYRSQDRGEIWERLPFTERGRQIWSLHFEPGDASTIYAGASPVEIFKSDDDGATWNALPGSQLPSRVKTGKFVNRVMRIHADPNNPSTVYGGSEVQGMMRSLDGGASWEDCNSSLIEMVERRRELRSAILTENEYEGILDVHALCCSPAAPGTVFMASRVGLFSSSDQGDTWNDLGIKRFSPHAYGRDIKVAPTNPSVLYACLSESSHGQTGGVYKSADLGVTWSRFDDGIEPKGTMMAVAPHPTEPSGVYAATRAGEVFGTLDGGKTWKDFALPDGCEGVYSLACGR